MKVIPSILCKDSRSALNLKLSLQNTKICLWYHGVEGLGGSVHRGMWNCGNFWLNSIPDASNESSSWLSVEIPRHYLSATIYSTQRLMMTLIILILLMLILTTVHRYNGRSKGGYSSQNVPQNFLFCKKKQISEKNWTTPQIVQNAKKHLASPLMMGSVPGPTGGSAPDTVTGSQSVLTMWTPNSGSGSTSAAVHVSEWVCRV